MDTMNAQRAPREDQRRRQHAPAENSVDTGRCGAKLGQQVGNDVDPELVTCCACRARLRDAGVLPMTPQALARRARDRR